MLRIYNKALLLFLFLVIPLSALAQDGAYGAYTPYSIFGIGELRMEGSAYNRSMGGVGIATRNKRFINYVNPASITAKDSLSFMADIGLSQKNSIYQQGNLKSGNNTFNMYDFILSFPIYRSSAFIVGITPFSDLGYDFKTKVTDPSIIGHTGNVTYTASGNGSVYQVFAGAAATFWKCFSVGAEVIYYFGSLDKTYNQTFAEASYNSVTSTDNLLIRATTGKFGLQYEQSLGRGSSLVIGATYKLKTGIRGRTVSSETLGSISDTLRYNTSNNSAVSIADEFGVGISFRKSDRWSVELNYLRSGWNKSGFENVNGFSVDSDAFFSTTATNSFRAGFEIVPNRNDIRYYRKKIAYRVGAYYDQSYYRLDGNKINSVGVTFGVTLPVFKLYNGITLGVDAGQKGSMKHNMVRERYAMFVIGFNIHDIWFHKPKYE